MLRSFHCLSIVSVSAIVTAMGGTACAPCDAGGDTAPLSACVASTQIVVDEGGREVLTVAGTIAAIEAATLDSESCLRSNSIVGDGVEESADGLVRLSIQTDEEVVAVVLRLLDEVPFVAGDDVTVDYRFAFGGFGPDAGRLVLTGGGSGALVYLEEAGALEGLAPPGVELARGEQRCWTHDGCGAFGRYDVVVEGDGDTTPLSIDDATVIDDVAFRASALVEQDQNHAVQCLDWFAGHVLVSGVKGRSGAR